MNLKKYFFVVLAGLYFLNLSCRQSSSNEKAQDFSWRIIKSNRLENTDVKDVTINIPVKKFNYSFNGNWFCIDTTLVLFDNLFRTVSEISLNGRLLKQQGGVDTGKNKNGWWLPYTLSKTDSGYVSIFLRSIAYTDTAFRVKKIREIKYKGGANLKSILDVPDPDNMNVYELNERNKSYCKTSNEEFLVSLESEAPSFNPYNSLAYYKTSRCFGLVNVRKRTLVGIPINKSKLYQDTCCLSVQDASYIIKKGNEYHVQFAADTLIYVYNETFIPQYAYGLKGKFIPNFIHNNSLDIAFDDEKYKSLESKANTIDALFLLDNKTVGRVVNNRTTGKKYLQIFSDTDLRAEYEVPVTFSFIGITNNTIVGLTKQDESKKQIELCIVKY